MAVSSAILNVPFSEDRMRKFNLFGGLDGSSKTTDNFNASAIFQDD